MSARIYSAVNLIWREDEEEFSQAAVAQNGQIPVELVLLLLCCSGES